MLYLTVPGFSPQARPLRRHFDARFADPLHTRADRFVWDYWNVPGEYTVLRTPAFEYFPQALYRKFHTHLVNWGRENLGCHDVSPTWLSAYVDGCEQQLHRDQPHGPLAFVFSLTAWERRNFRGGETMIRSGRSFVSVPARFNQLLVFNPDAPHRVSKVRGSQDPREARLVINGWFVQPRAFWKGGRTARQIGAALDEQLPGLAEHVSSQTRGFCSLRLRIDSAGVVKASRIVCETLSRPGDRQRVLDFARRMRFSRSRSSTLLTLPLMFGR